MDKNQRYINMIKIQSIDTYANIGATESVGINRNSSPTYETIAIS